MHAHAHLLIYAYMYVFLTHSALRFCSTELTCGYNHTHTHVHTSHTHSHTHTHTHTHMQHRADWLADERVEKMKAVARDVSGFKKKLIKMHSV